MYIYISTNRYLRWFGARWFGILGVPPSNNPFHQGIQGIQTSQQVIQYVTKLDPRSLEVTKKLWKIRHVWKPSQKRSPAELPCMVYIYIYTYIYIWSQLVTRFRKHEWFVFDEKESRWLWRAGTPNLTTSLGLKERWLRTHGNNNYFSQPTKTPLGESVSIL